MFGSFVIGLVIGFMVGIMKDQVWALLVSFFNKIRNKVTRRKEDSQK